MVISQEGHNLEQVLLNDKDLDFIKEDLRGKSWDSKEFFQVLYDLEKTKCGVYTEIINRDKKYVNNLNYIKDLLFQCYNNAYERFVEIKPY